MLLVIGPWVVSHPKLHYRMKKIHFISSVVVIWCISLLYADHQIKIFCTPIKNRKSKTKAQNPEVKHTKENYSHSAKEQIKQKFIVNDCYSHKKQFLFISSRKACRFPTENFIYSWIYCLNFYTTTFKVNCSLV